MYVVSENSTPSQGSHPKQRAAPWEGVLQIPWTPEETARCIEHWTASAGGQGTADLLASEFGVRRTKNSIISRMARLGFSFKGRSSPQVMGALAARSGGQTRSAARRKAAPKAAPVPRVAKPAPRPAPRPASDVAIPESRRVALTDLRAGECRWISGDPRVDASCCGHPVDPGSTAWCTAHRAIGTVGVRRPATTFVTQRKAA